MTSTQRKLYSNTRNKFPSTRYQGSKLKLINWIWDKVKDLNFTTCLDAFGGTGAVAYKFKQMNKTVTYNDILKFNHIFGKAIIENKNIKLTKEDINFILNDIEDIEYSTLIQDTFKDIYFTKSENIFLDKAIANINHLNNPYKYSLAFFALSQACIIKRPYNLFHRKNLYIRTNEVKRSFGNKTTWDKPFTYWFKKFTEEANNAVFDNGAKNISLNYDAMDIEDSYDLVYIDTPYISSKGSKVNYRDFYHFLEGLTDYNNWYGNIDFNSKHRKLISVKSPWTNKKEITNAFDLLFNKFSDSKLLVSYGADGIPSISKIKELLEQYKNKVTVYDYGNYKYALSKNNKTKEILFIGE